MGPFLAAAIPAAGSLLGGLFGQHSQQDFQERMSSTAWQRGVADMRKAGVNPLLAIGGAQASSPQGAGLDLGSVAANAMQGMRLNEELKLVKQQAFATNAQGLKTGTEAETVLQTQPYLVRAAKAAAQGAELGLAEREAMQQWWKTIGRGEPALKTLVPLLKLIFGR